CGIERASGGPPGRRRPALDHPSRRVLPGGVRARRAARARAAARAPVRPHRRSRRTSVITFVVGDLTAQEADAIVNAATEALAPGGGVCGAIRRAGGDEIFVECADLGSCATGDAKATGAGRLPAHHVIHAVGPVWHGGGAGEAELLASAHRRALEVA